VIDAHERTRNPPPMRTEFAFVDVARRAGTARRIAAEYRAEPLVKDADKPINGGPPRFTLH